MEGYLLDLVSTSQHAILSSGYTTTSIIVVVGVVSQRIDILQKRK